MAYTYIWETRGLHRIFSGDITGDEILESNFELHANPKYNKIDYVIDDFSGIASCAIDHSHLEVIAKTNDIIAMTKGALKIALAVVDDEAIALAHTYKKMTENSRFQCEVFLSINEALDWVK